MRALGAMLSHVVKGVTMAAKAYLCDRLGCSGSYRSKPAVLERRKPGIRPAWPAALHSSVIPLNLSGSSKAAAAVPGR